MGGRLRRILLSVVQETDDHIVGDDVNGNPMRFAKRGVSFYVIDRKNESVTVHYRPGQLEQLTPGKVKVAEYGSLKNQRTARNCLNCGHPFEADPSKRICTPCKHSSYYRSGSDFSFLQ